METGRGQQHKVGVIRLNAQVLNAFRYRILHKRRDRFPTQCTLGDVKAFRMSSTDVPGRLAGPCRIYCRITPSYRYRQNSQLAYFRSCKLLVFLRSGE